MRAPAQPEAIGANQPASYNGADAAILVFIKLGKRQRKHLAAVLIGDRNRPVSGVMAILFDVILDHIRREADCFLARRFEVWQLKTDSVLIGATIRQMKKVARHETFDQKCAKLRGLSRQHIGAGGYSRVDGK